MTQHRGWEGLLPLDKPVGPSSHDMVALARARLGIRRVGHTGTLDPFASGLLLICLGRSTRLVEYLHALPKVYVARARLGITTASDDPEGEVIATSDSWQGLTEEEIAKVVQGFRGVIQQRPPSYSAKKVDGVKAYVRSRKGEEVSLNPVSVTINEIGLEKIELPYLRFKVRCETGTYIRALARDLGERLGVGAHLTELRRLSIGPFRVEDALTADALLEPERVAEAVIPPLEALPHLPRLEVTREEAERLQSGQALHLEPESNSSGDGEHAVVFESRLLAVAVRDGGQVRPKKVFCLD